MNSASLPKRNDLNEPLLSKGIQRRYNQAVFGKPQLLNFAERYAGCSLKDQS
jgi:hypothetical protein